MQNFRALGAPPQTPVPPAAGGSAPNSPKHTPRIANFWLRACCRPPTHNLQLQISAYAPESDDVFALLIFMPPEFSLMPRFKSISFYRMSVELSYFCNKNNIFCVLGALLPDLQWPLTNGDEAIGPPSSPSHHCRILVTRPILNVCCTYFQVLESYYANILI